MRAVAEQHYRNQATNIGKDDIQSQNPIFFLLNIESFIQKKKERKRESRDTNCKVVLVMNSSGGHECFLLWNKVFGPTISPLPTNLFSIYLQQPIWSKLIGFFRKYELKQRFKQNLNIGKIELPFVLLHQRSFSLSLSQARIWRQLQIETNRRLNCCCQIQGLSKRIGEKRRNTKRWWIKSNQINKRGNLEWVKRVWIRNWKEGGLCMYERMGSVILFVWSEKSVPFKR